MGLYLICDYRPNWTSSCFVEIKFLEGKSESILHRQCHPLLAKERGISKHCGHFPSLDIFPCLAFVWAESTNYILLAGGQALNDTIPRTNITQQTLLTRVRHRTRDARLAASNQASAGYKPTVLMKNGARSQ